MIVAIQTNTKNQENIISLPNIRVITESYSNLAETNIIEMLINIEKMYSAFPCPKLWSSSPGALAILLPINVISDAKISLALLMLSAIIDWLLLTNPTIAFIINKNILPTIP